LISALGGSLGLFTGIAIIMIFEFFELAWDLAFNIWCQFHQRSTSSFCASRSQKRKKILTTWLNYYAFGSNGRKSCTYICWWNRPQALPESSTWQKQHKSYRISMTRRICKWNENENKNQSQPANFRTDYVKITNTSLISSYHIQFRHAFQNVQQKRMHKRDVVIRFM